MSGARENVARVSLAENSEKIGQQQDGHAPDSIFVAAQHGAQIIADHRVAERAKREK
jgi:hypothetical protein